ncbi:MAG TPA: hypothetical protein VI756_02745 [Blastocatellia bacterium]
MADQDEMNTKPILETILERVKTLGEMMDKRLTAIETEVSGLRGEVSDLKSQVAGLTVEITELRGRQDKVEAALDRMTEKFEIVSIDLLDMRARVRSVNHRVDKLEGNPS